MVVAEGACTAPLCRAHFLALIQRLSFVVEARLLPSEILLSFLSNHVFNVQAVDSLSHLTPLLLTQYSWFACFLLRWAIERIVEHFQGVNAIDLSLVAIHGL